MENVKKSLFDSIVQDLADNYSSGDLNIVQNILDDIITNAFFFSNRKSNELNLKLLSLEIKECVKSIYLRRGTEEVHSLSEGGKNSTYKDALEKLRNDIIKNGKRVIF